VDGSNRPAGWDDFYPLAKPYGSQVRLRRPIKAISGQSWRTMRARVAYRDRPYTWNCPVVCLDVGRTNVVALDQTPEGAPILLD
jgi:hypothetical protein